MLIAIEGIDGAGKSTQTELLLDWLQDAGYRVFQTKWNSSSIVKPAAKHAKKARTLTPTTFALLEAADLADRYDREIQQALVDGRVVVADRWVYTAFARGMARNLDAAWLRGIYSFAPKPDVCFYLPVPVEIALERIERLRPVKYYEAGLDVVLSCTDPAASFREFQAVALTAYNGMQMAENCFVSVPRGTVEEQHATIACVVGQRLYAEREAAAKGRAVD